MKKIYSLIFALAAGTTLMAQSQTVENPNGFMPTSKKIPTKSSYKVTAAGMSGRFDPGYALCTMNGVQDSEIGGGSTGTKVGLYVSGTNCDSTLKTSFTTDAFITTHKFGMNFDPKSIIYDQVTFNPLLTATESYFLDTVWVGGFYQRKTAFNDTLLVEIVWGDTSNTSVYAKYSLAAPYSYYGTMCGPKFNSGAGVNTVQGSKQFLTAPAANKIVIRHVLTDADSLKFNTEGYIPIVVNGATGALIPANNIVSASASFIPGQAGIPVGSVAYNPGTGITPQTVNGMVARIYSQNTPATPSSGNDYFDDLAEGKNHSIFTFKRERYGLAGAFPGMRIRLASAFMIDFSIHTSTTVTSVKNIENSNGITLGQNMPNPFTNGSTVNYQLAKDVTSAVFTVTDIMGRVISSEKVETTTGIHSVKLGAYAAGVYYYSLNIDGIVKSKKMIVE